MAKVSGRKKSIVSKNSTFSARAIKGRVSRGQRGFLAKSTSRKTVNLILVMLLFLCVGVWGTIASVYDYGLEGIKPLGMGYANEVQLTVDTFDPETRLVGVTAKSDLSNPQVLLPVSIKHGPFDKPISTQPTTTITFGNLQLDDLAPFYQFSGIGMAQLPLQQIPDCTSPAAHPQEAVKTIQQKSASMIALPHPLIGHSWFSRIQGPLAYPFDRYLVLIKADRFGVRCEPGNRAVIGSRLELTAVLPGYSLHQASPGELKTWPYMLSDRTDGHPAEYDPDLWVYSRAAIVIERPAFLRWSTAIIVLVTGFAVLLLGLRGPAQDIERTFAGSMFVIWTARGLVISNAPKQPNILDLVVMAIFLALALIFIGRFILRDPIKSAN